MLFLGFLFSFYLENNANDKYEIVTLEKTSIHDFKSVIEIVFKLYKKL